MMDILLRDCRKRQRICVSGIGAPTPRSRLSCGGAMVFALLKVPVAQGLDRPADPRHLRIVTASGIEGRLPAGFSTIPGEFPALARHKKFRCIIGSTRKN